MGWFNMRAQLKSAQDFAAKCSARTNELEVQLTEASNELIMLKRKIADRDTEETKADFAFDFNVVNAFSIERNVHDGRPCTLIGYMLPTEEVKDGTITNSDKVREWYLYCSMDQHKALVKAFKESRK